MVSAIGFIPSQDIRGARRYFSQTATGGAALPPTVSDKSVLPGARNPPPGVRTLSCITPIIPGAPPANRISAGTPAMVRVTGSRGAASGTPAGLPVTFDPSVRPSPVANNVSNVLGGADDASLLSVPSWLVTSGSRAGEAAATGKSTAAFVCPR